MPDMTMEEFQLALARHASARGEVYPSALGLIDAEGHPTGRVWHVARLVKADQEQMRYLSGGNRPDEGRFAVVQDVIEVPGGGERLERVGVVSRRPRSRSRSVRATDSTRP
jgi:hypothetical protein